jgi:hypothetical protein
LRLTTDDSFGVWRHDAAFRLRIAEFGLRIWNIEMVRMAALPEIPRGKAPTVSGGFQSAIRNPNSAIKKRRHAAALQKTLPHL